MTPYGAPSPQAYVYAIPKECVGLIIGKGGEMIKHLQQKTGVKISVAKADIPDTNQRNIFIEGNLQKYDIAKTLIDQLIQDHMNSLGMLATYPISQFSDGTLVETTEISNKNNLSSSKSLID